MKREYRCPECREVLVPADWPDGPAPKDHLPSRMTCKTEGCENKNATWIVDYTGNIFPYAHKSV